MWRNESQFFGDAKCHGPEIWGQPQHDRPWRAIPCHDIQWGIYRVVNIGPRGRNLQWFEGILFCTKCGWWTAQ
eukprot:195510-Karenia_brevis.AAC.1